MEWNAEKVLLYHPFVKPEGKKLKKYPLLDLLAANKELKLDEVSEFMAEYKIQENHTNVVNKYFKLLKTKTNQKKLARILDPENFNDDNIKRGLISIILDFNSVEDRFNCMNKWITISLVSAESFRVVYFHCCFKLLTRNHRTNYGSLFG
jgi:hypothetical protein